MRQQLLGFCICYGYICKLGKGDIYVIEIHRAIPVTVALGRSKCPLGIVQIVSFTRLVGF